MERIEITADITFSSLINTLSSAVEAGCWCEIDDERGRLTALGDLIVKRLKEPVSPSCIE